MDTTQALDELEGHLKIIMEALQGAKDEMDRAVAVEREACAQIADAIEYPANFNLQRSGAWIDCQEAIVAAIRARGAK